jgi:hypothetical protein
MPVKAAKRPRGRPSEFGAGVPGFPVWPEIVAALDFLALDTGLSKAHHMRAALVEYLVARELVLPQSAPTKTSGPSPNKKKTRQVRYTYGQSDRTKR